MKTIYLIRHAKSSWKDFNLDDHDRPLNARGKRDAPRMAAELLRRGIRPDGILTSTAKRAKRTARAFAEAFALPAESVLKESGLYHAGPRRIEECVRGLPAGWSTVFVFGHNPGFTEAANALEHEIYLDNVPTCGVVGSASPVANWNEWTLGGARRTLYLFPKAL